MNTTYSIFVKALGELPVNKRGDRVVHSESNVAAVDMYARQRELEKLYPPGEYMIQAKMQDPLSV